MEKIPAAEEIMLKHCNTKTNDYGTFFSSISDIQCRNAMIEFAKIHVEAVLKTASEKARVQMGESYMREQIIIHPNSLVDTVIITADAESILNSYSLDNIK